MGKEQIAMLAVNIALMALNVYRNDIAKYSKENPGLLVVLNSVAEVLEAVTVAAESEPKPEEAPPEAPQEALQERA